VPRKIVTDQLRSYPAAKADIPELANVKHVFVKAAARLNKSGRRQRRKSGRPTGRLLTLCIRRFPQPVPA